MPSAVGVEELDGYQPTRRGEPSTISLKDFECASLGRFPPSGVKHTKCWRPALARCHSQRRLIIPFTVVASVKLPQLRARAGA